MAFINLSLCLRVVFNDSATIQIYSYRHTLSLHDALPISRPRMAEKIGRKVDRMDANQRRRTCSQLSLDERSEEHTSELQSLMRNSYAVFCLKKKKIMARACFPQINNQ